MYIHVLLPMYMGSHNFSHHQDFHRRVVPSVGLDKVIVSDELARSLKEIVQFEKAR